MTIECTKCKRHMKHVKDDETEKLGGYTFDCACGEEVIVPKEYPHLIIFKENTVPKECYEAFGQDLDGCSSQSSMGCTSCVCYKNGIVPDREDEE